MGRSGPARPGSREAIVDWAASVDRLLGDEPLEDQPRTHSPEHLFSIVRLRGGGTARVGFSKIGGETEACVSIEREGEVVDLRIPADVLGEVVVGLADVHRHLRPGSMSLRGGRR